MTVVDKKDHGRCTTPDSCNGVYHLHCLSQWVEQKHNCPTCRRKITDVGYILKLTLRGAESDASLSTATVTTTTSTREVKRRKSTPRRVRCIYTVMGGTRSSRRCKSTFSSVNAAMKHMRWKHTARARKPFIFLTSVKMHIEINCRPDCCTVRVPPFMDKTTVEFQQALLDHLKEYHPETAQDIVMRT